MENIMFKFNQVGNPYNSLVIPILKVPDLLELHFDSIIKRLMVPLFAGSPP